MNKIQNIQYQTEYINTHEFLEVIELTQDPLEPERYVLPQGQYLEEPPKHKKGFQIVRNQEKWEYVKDYRNTPLYILDDNKEYTIDEYVITHSSEYKGLGELPDYLSTQEKPKPKDKQKEIREERDTLLNNIDNLVMNPLRYQDFTETEKNDIQEYRLALLDVPQQSGFPENIEWPEVPDVLKNNIDINILDTEDLNG